MKPLTPKQRQHLNKAIHKPIPLTIDPDDHTTSRHVLYRLNRLGYLQRTNDGHKLTPAGRTALNQPIPHTTCLLMAGSPAVGDSPPDKRDKLSELQEHGYTSSTRYAVHQEPEVITADLAWHWAADAHERHRNARPPRTPHTSARNLRAA